MPAHALKDFVSALAHRIAGFPAAARVALKERINAIALAPLRIFAATPTFSAKHPRLQSFSAGPGRPQNADSRRATENSLLRECWAIWRRADGEPIAYWTLVSIRFSDLSIARPVAVLMAGFATLAKRRSL